MLLHLFSYPLHLLLTHGYAALFIWSILEGEIGLMLAGWLAKHHEIFTYDKVIFVAIIGALIGDSITFTFGRLFKQRAQAWLDAHPAQKQKALSWLHKYGAYIIIFERFIYGTHIPVLLTIGMSGFSVLRFYLFDIIGVILWALTFTSIGYFFGDSAIQLILFIQKDLLALLFLLAILWLFFKNNHAQRRK